MASLTLNETYTTAEHTRDLDCYLKLSCDRPRAQINATSLLILIDPTLPEHSHK